MRRCAVRREVCPESQLVRFVAGPDGNIVPDLQAELPGRGVWISACRSSIDEAVDRSAFARSLKAQVSAPEGLADLVADLLEKRCLSGLGLARKSGVLATGFEKVTAQIRAGKAALLAEASDGAEDGRSKVLGILAKSVPNAYVIGAFSKDQLGLALGMENVVHASVSCMRHAARLATDAGRLGGFRSVLPGHWKIPGTLRAVSGTGAECTAPPSG